MISRNELEKYAAELLSELFEEDEGSEVEIDETEEIQNTEFRNLRFKTVAFFL